MNFHFGSRIVATNEEGYDKIIRQCNFVEGDWAKSVSYANKIVYINKYTCDEWRRVAPTRPETKITVDYDMEVLKLENSGETWFVINFMKGKTYSFTTTLYEFLRDSELTLEQIFMVMQL